MESLSLAPGSWLLYPGRTPPSFDFAVAPFVSVACHLLGPQSNPPVPVPQPNSPNPHFPIRDPAAAFPILYSVSLQS